MRRDRIFKTFATIFVVGSIVWLGGDLVRNSIAYDLFIPSLAELKLDPTLDEAARTYAVKLFATASFYVNVGFVAAFISSFFVVSRLGKSARKSGWFFMSTVLFYIAAAVNLVLLYLDVNLELAAQFDRYFTFTSEVVRKNFIFRYEKLGAPSWLAFLSALTAIVFLIWKPLDKTKPDSTQES